MDYRDAYRQYERSGAYNGSAAGYKHPMEDAFDRSRKRGRSPSLDFDRYAERRASQFSAYPAPATDFWDRDPRERSPYAASASAAPGARVPPYDDYREADPYDRERERALEWERYYRERDAEYAGGAYGDRERYPARSRYDDEDLRERDYRRSDRGYPHGGAPDTPYRRDGPSPNKMGDIAAPDPLQSETLLPFRSYAQMIKSGHPSSRDRSIEAPTTQELYEGYQGYRLAYTKKAMWAFFEQRKDEAWFKEKYAVTEEFVESRQSRKRAGREGRKEAWLQELETGKLDQIDFDMKSAGEGEEGTVTVSRHGEQETIVGDQVTIPASSSQLLIKSFPPDISREKLELHLKSRDGFKYLALGEPHSGKRWHRVGWAIYKEGTDMEETLQALDGKEIDNFTLHLALANKSASGKLRTVPEYANSFARLTQDLRQVKQLLAQFEAEDQTLFKDEDAKWLNTSASEAIMARHAAVNPEVNEELERGYDPEEDASKREERRSRLKKHLDLHIDLLRTAYHCDYYLSLTCEFPEELTRRSPRHVRKQPAPGTLVEEPRESTNDESWAKSVDQKTSLLLSDEKTDLTEFGGKSVEGELMNAALPFVKEEEKEKHRCIVEVAGAQCGKLFKASIFVQKHVMNKHRAFLDEHADGTIQEAKFFNNYVRDPCRTQAPAVAPSAASSSTPLSHRFAPPPASSPFDSPTPLFPTSRVGLIRLGNMAPEASSPSLGMRIGSIAPLPDPPKPLDPRAARSAPKSYQDLDGDVAEGDVDLAY